MPKNRNVIDSSEIVSRNARIAASSLALTGRTCTVEPSRTTTSASRAHGYRARSEALDVSETASSWLRPAAGGSPDGGRRATFWRSATIVVDGSRRNDDDRAVCDVLQLVRDATYLPSSALMRPCSPVARRLQRDHRGISTVSAIPQNLSVHGASSIGTGHLCASGK